MHYSVKGTTNLIIFVILAKVMSSHRASGFITNISRPIHCQGSTATIDFDLNLQGDSIVSGSKVWFFNRILIAEDTGSGFMALNNYTSRLTSHSSHGLTISNVTTADNGTYEHEILLAAGLTPSTATASLTVYIGPLAPSSSSGCSVNTSQSGNTVTCSINGNCGIPPLSPSWVNFTTTSNQLECTVKGTYMCCATSDALISCYSGSPNDFCTTFDCASNLCKLEHGVGLGLGLGITGVIVCIVAVIIVSFIYKGDKYAYKLGLLLGLGLGITYQVGWIIIVSLISTGNQWKLELGLGLGLGSGISCVIACVVAVIFMFFVCKGSPSRVNIGKGILTGLLIASVVSIIVVYLLCEKPEEKTPEPTGQKHKTKDTWPRAVHTGTQNKVESITTSKKTNDRHQPLPPSDTGVEDAPKSCPKPPPPQNSDIKDQNQQRIPATTDNTRGLAYETPRPKKLIRFTEKQATVHQEGASERTKKKRKKKKKKDQMNEGNPEEEMVELEITRTVAIVTKIN